MRYLKLILLAMLLSSCAVNKHWWKPNGKVFRHMPKTDNEVYKAAWLDGCGSGLTAFTKEFNKSFYRFHKDLRFSSSKPQYFNGKLITPEDQKMYGRVWAVTYSICRQFGLGANRSGFSQYGNNTPGLPSGDNAKLGKLDKLQNAYEIEAWGPVGIAGW
jgi:hypothetical protein